MKNLAEKHKDLCERLQDCGFNSPEKNEKAIKIVTDLVSKRLETIASKKPIRRTAHARSQNRHEVACVA